MARRLHRHVRVGEGTEKMELTVEHVNLVVANKIHGPSNTVSICRIRPPVEARVNWKSRWPESRESFGCNPGCFQSHLELNRKPVQGGELVQCRNRPIS